ncbi:MAG: prepilin-type N-terminal cleavage/methylation domain-containing protein [Patescibacteria group bacterium]
MKTNINKTKKAFTLMEVVVIMFILSIGLVAVLSLVRKSSEFESVKKNLLTAAFLSQEGIDIMRNIRDTNIILGDDYDKWDGIASPLVGDTYYYKVDYLSLLATTTVDIDTSLLQLDNGMFVHLSGGEDSIFKRMISVTPSSSGYTHVESWVKWFERGQAYDFKLETIIYDLSN